MDLAGSYNFAEKLNFYGFEYPLLISSLLPDDKRKAIAAIFASFWSIASEINEIAPGVDQSGEDSDQMVQKIDQWLSWIEAANNGKIGDHILAPALSDSMQKFILPINPWAQYSRALKASINKQEVQNLAGLESYANNTYGPIIYGFLHILAARKKSGGYELAVNPCFLSNDLSTYIFMIGSLVDLSRDLTLSRHKMIYVPFDILEKNGLDQEVLLSFYESGQTDGRFKRLVDDMYHLIREYELYCREKLIVIRGDIGKEEWFSLDLLMNIYSHMMVKIWEFPDSIFNGGYPIDPAMVYINALKLQKDLGLDFHPNISRLLAGAS